MTTHSHHPRTTRLGARSALVAGILFASTTLLGACMGVRSASTDDGTAGQLVYVDGQPVSDKAIATELARLNIQVTYLARELDALTSRLPEGAGRADTWTLEDRTRFGLLNEMYAERWRRIEGLKMEQLAASVAPR